MLTAKFDNWQDKRGSALDRAKSIVSDPKVSPLELSKLTKIQYQAIRDLRYKPERLDKASWQRVNTLAQAYEIYELTNAMTQDDVTDIHGILSEYIQRLKTDYSGSEWDQAAINALSEVILSDPLILYEVFQSTKNIK